MRSSPFEFLLGALVLVLAGWFMNYTSENTSWGSVSGYELTASFQRADGLDIGKDVRLAGVRVGKVTGIDLDGRLHQATVRMVIEKRVQLPLDTSARISSDAILGGSYVTIEPGFEEEYLEDGDAFEFTQGYIDLSDLLRHVIPSQESSADTADQTTSHQVK